MLAEKTNVMRMLDQKEVDYIPRWYPCNGAVDGVSVAAILGQDPAGVFKTLVTVGASGKNYVFVIPVAADLDLKAAAEGPQVSDEKCQSLIGRKLLHSGYDNDIISTQNFMNGKYGAGI